MTNEGPLLLIGAWAIFAAACSEPAPNNPTSSAATSTSEPVETATTATTGSTGPVASATSAPTETATASLPPGAIDWPNMENVHARSEGHDVYRRSNGTCYVQIPKKGSPPKDFIPGEKWVEDKVLKCPKQFDDPGFAAIPEQLVWYRNKKTGECFHITTFGDPPVGPKRVDCPASLKKAP